MSDKRKKYPDGTMDKVREYRREGKTLIVFAQDHGYDYGNLAKYVTRQEAKASDGYNERDNQTMFYTLGRADYLKFKGFAEERGLKMASIVRDLVETYIRKNTEGSK